MLPHSGNEPHAGLGIAHVGLNIEHFGAKAAECCQRLGRCRFLAHAADCQIKTFAGQAPGNAETDPAGTTRY